MFFFSPCVIMYKRLRAMISRNQARIEELEREVSGLKDADEQSERELAEAKVRLAEVERTIRAARAQVFAHSGPQTRGASIDVEP